MKNALEIIGEKIKYYINSLENAIAESLGKTHEIVFLIPKQYWLLPEFQDKYLKEVMRAGYVVKRSYVHEGNTFYVAIDVQF